MEDQNMATNETVVRNGPVQSAEELARELAAVQDELAKVRRQRDEYRDALFGFLQKEAIARREEDEEQMKHAVSDPPMEEFVASLFKS
jgi:hypothetical protein